jgi:hypothetical protein
VSSSDFNWLLLDGHYGLNQNEWSVPTFDHTTNQAQGSFIYLDTNNKQENKKSLIESEIISNDMGFMCLQFYLKTNVNNKATLNLNRKNKINGQQVALFSTSEAISEDAWMFKEVQLPDKSTSTIDYPYSVVFEGVVGLNTASLKGQLAIDDIKLYNGTCLGTTTPIPGQFDCLNGQFISFNQVCNFIFECFNGQDEKYCGTCDFEDSKLCGWTDNSVGIFHWVRTRNGSQQNNLGPNLDHTLNSTDGFYMSVNITSGLGSEPALLFSPELQYASSKCQIKFSYLFNPDWTTGTLNVALYINKEKKATLFRKKSFPSVTSWTEAVVDLGLLKTFLNLILIFFKFF